MTAYALAGLLCGRPKDSARTMTDHELVAKAQEGDTACFDELVRRHQTVVYNLAWRYMRENAAAEDMAQEAFLKAFRMLHGFRGDCTFSTWMYRVTSSVCLTELNRRKRRGEVELTPAVESQLGVDAEVATDTPEAIRRCVALLPDHYAKIITLYYLNESSYEEIAEIMDIPLGTLKTWMHRARKQLREIVEREVAEVRTDGLS